MLVLKRKEGQWVDIIHKDGDRLRIRACRIRGGSPGQLDLAFDDDARNFEIQRPERRPADLHEEVMTEDAPSDLPRTKAAHAAVAPRAVDRPSPPLGGVMGRQDR